MIILFKMNDVAAAILINEEEKLLLYLRDNKSTIPYPNHWSLLGGHVEDGETLIQALKRELQEEIEYNAKGFSFVGIFYDSFENRVCVYKTGMDKRLENLKLNEGQKLDFFSFEESLGLKIPKCLKDFLIKNEGKIKEHPLST